MVTQIYTSPRVTTLEQSWSHNGIEFQTGNTVYRLGTTFITTLDRLNDRIANAKENKFVQTAHGRALDRLGNLANVTRRENESDAKFRKRIIAVIRGSTSGTTYSEVTRFAALLLELPIGDIEWDFQPRNFPGTAFLVVTQTMVDNSPFTAEEIADLVDRVVPADHDVVVQLEGTFIFKDVGATDDPEHGFTDDDVEGGTFTGERGTEDPNI